jgi:hypothetical protein
MRTIQKKIQETRGSGLLLAFAARSNGQLRITVHTLYAVGRFLIMQQLPEFF